MAFLPMAFQNPKACEGGGSLGVLGVKRTDRGRNRG